MGVNRISSGFLTSQSVNYLNTNLELLSRLQEKLSSNQNINKPSDDPVGLTRILDLSNTLTVDERYRRNVEGGLSELRTTDTVLGNMTDVLQRARELGVQGATATNNQSNRDAIAQEVDQLITQLVQLGNTDIGGVYIFAGLKTGAPPFSRTGNDVTFAGTNPTEPYQRNVEISQGIQTPINVNGQSVLGQSVVTAAVPPTFGAGSGGIFQALVELKLNLQQGDLTEVRQRLDDLNTGLDQLSSARAQIGATTNRLELTLSRIEDRKSTFTQQYSAIQDIDTAKTITELNFQQNVYQQSLAVSARILQPSILQYLR